MSELDFPKMNVLLVECWCGKRLAVNFFEHEVIGYSATTYDIGKRNAYAILERKLKHHINFEHRKVEDYSTKSFK